jgi:mannosyltransferase OCH1-like enzyme
MTPKIPPMIYQTFKTARMPSRMRQASELWKRRNPSFGYQFFDDEQLQAFVAEFPCEDFPFDSATLVTALKSLRSGAGKADLFRYLLIYQRGGVYMDIDTVCLRPIHEYLQADDDLVSGSGERGDLHQWGLMYSPRHPFLRRAIENMVANVLNRRFVAGFEGTLEGIGGPPCLDESIKQVLGIPPTARFEPGVYRLPIAGRTYQHRLLPGNLFDGAVAFKYRGYAEDLSAAGVQYWEDEVALFNDSI